MKRFIFRVSFVLLLVIVVPIIFFISKQFSNLSENEEIVQQAYEKQLESVLFSININSENIFNSWINRIDLPVEDDSDILKKIIKRIFDENTSLQQITFLNISDRKVLKTFVSKDAENKEINFPDSLEINKLKQFKQAGYQRIDAQRAGENTVLFFLPKSTDRDIICAFIISTKTFINVNLNSGIQQVAQDKFIITIADSLHHETIFGQDISNEKVSKNYQQDFWYLPGFQMNIRLQAATIDDVIKERSKRDSYFLIALMVFVLLGSAFVIMNIRREIKLAEIKSEFVSSVSHEIRTPLALISMYAETLLLKRVKNEGKVEEYLNVIHLETNRLSSMVSRILSFSKMEKNKRMYNFEPIQLNEIVKEVADNFKPYFSAQKVCCNLQLRPGLEEVVADREAVIEVLINILENAVKYGNVDQKQIEVRTIQTLHFINIEVEDNGIGIASKHIKHIFEKFYRVTQGDLAHKAKGTGLGLNIVQQIMKKHGGRVAVESRPGVGSCFRLQFSTKPK